MLLTPKCFQERTVALKRREELLAPIYHTVAVHFADLHDTPIRMKEKNVIQEVIPWRQARTRLHWRLKRRLLEASLKAEIDGCGGGEGTGLDHGQKTEMLRRWFIEDSRVDNRHVWETDDIGVCRWLADQAAPSTRARLVGDNLKALKRDRTVRKFRSLVDDMCPDVMLEAGVVLAQKMDASKRQDFLNSIRAVLSELHSDEDKPSKKVPSSNSSENGDS